MTNAEYYKNQGLTYEDIFNFWVQRQPKDNRSLNKFFWWLDAERPTLTKEEKELLQMLVKMYNLSECECVHTLDSRFKVYHNKDVVIDIPTGVGKYFAGMKLGKLYRVSYLLLN